MQRNDVIYCAKKVMEITGLSRVTLWRLARQNLFPTPIRIGIRAVGWRASEIDEWMASRSAERAA